MTSLEKALHAFAQFAAKLKGDEKSEAQTFLFHLLEAFGHDSNTLPKGCTFEYRVRFAGERINAGRRKGFAQWGGRQQGNGQGCAFNFSPVAPAKHASTCLRSPSE